MFGTPMLLANTESFFSFDGAISKRLVCALGRDRKLNNSQDYIICSLMNHKLDGAAK